MNKEKENNVELEDVSEVLSKMHKLVYGVEADIDKMINNCEKVKKISKNEKEGK